jgi:hypothetical protein
MADIEDLGYTSILNMGDDEAIDMLRQIRLARRTPEKTTRTITKSSKPKVSDMDASVAAEILKILGGSK